MAKSFRKSETCGCTACVQPFLRDASRKPCFRGISCRPRTAPKAWQEWLSFPTGEQQRSNGSAAVSHGREARGEPQSLPEQIALRKIIFPLFPAFVPATRERVSESKPSITGRRTARRQGLHPPSPPRAGTLTGPGVTMVSGDPGPSRGVCLAASPHSADLDSSSHSPLHLGASGLAARIVLLEEIKQCFVSYWPRKRRTCQSWAKTH